MKIEEKKETKNEKRRKSKQIEFSKERQRKGQARKGLLILRRSAKRKW